MFVQHMVHIHVDDAGAAEDDACEDDENEDDGGRDCDCDCGRGGIVGGGGAGLCFARTLAMVELVIELPLAPLAPLALLTTLSAPLPNVAGGGDRGRARELVDVMDETEPPRVEGVNLTCFLTRGFLCD